jgi:4-aminobutyrate--pyruvate transaminase
VADNTAKIGTFGHGFTTSGHPLASAVALENLKILEERDLMGTAARMGAILQRELQKFASHPLVGEVRGEGLIAGIELVADKTTKKPFAPQLKVGPRAFAIGHQHGIIVRAIGDTLALCPPLIINEAQVHEIVSRVSKTLDATAAALAAEGQAEKRYA